MVNFLKILIGTSIFIFTGCVSSESKPLTDQQIESICQKKKIESEKPITNLSLATGSEGPKYQIAITMSSDFISGRDPNEVYKQCMISLR
tara:strand:+ start:162 stop:431 length:270 start_codon:yes stop_codon:yes gene_type:complete